MRDGKIPDDVIEAVLKHHDILDVVGKYVSLTKQGKNYKGLCPFHAEKTPSFTVSPDKQIFHCFGCGTGGDAIRFIMAIEQYTFPEAVSHLAKEAGIPFHWEKSPRRAPEQEKEAAELLEAHQLAAKWFHYILRNTNHGKPAVRYLHQRGFNDKLIQTFQIGYAPKTWDTLAQFLQKKNFSLPLMEQGGLLVTRADGRGYVDRFRDRILFPIRDANGRVIAFAGRALAENVQPKYLNSPETLLFNKRKQLYNYDLAKDAIRKTQQVVLFEGYADVIKAWDAGITNSVATMGTALTEEHVRQIKRVAKQVVICYDGDDAGRNASLKNLPVLEKAKLSVKVAVLPEKMDPDEYIAANGPEKFAREVIETAVSAVKFRFMCLQKEEKLHDDESKLRYIRKALSIIASLSAPTEREYYLRSLADEQGFSYETLKQELLQIRRDLQKKAGNRDNIQKQWNNVMNENKVWSHSAHLLPAYHNAEKQLLALMMHSREITAYVEEQLGSQFNVEVHAALAAYLYKYYSEHHEPNVSRFIAMLDDDSLVRAASAITLIEFDRTPTQQVIDDYIAEVKRFPVQREIREKKEALVRLEKMGEFMRAAEIANEIITLEKHLKLLR